MVTISGGIISSQVGTTVTYQVKCDKCGNVEPDESTVNVTKGVTEVYSKKCSACGNNQIVKMKHQSEVKA